MRKMASIWGSKKSGVVIVFDDGETRKLTWEEWVEFANRKPEHGEDEKVA